MLENSPNLLQNMSLYQNLQQKLQVLSCNYSIDQFSYNAQTLAHGLATDADSSIQLSVGRASADFDIK